MEIGQIVKRTTGSINEKWSKARIIEIDSEKQRARLEWLETPCGFKYGPGKSKTWMSIKALIPA